jgi:hypothetical protein
MAEEETVVASESKTRIVKCERFALVWGRGLNDAHIFIFGTCPRPTAPSTCGFERKEKHADVTVYLLVETVEHWQALLIVLRNNLEPRRRKKVAQAILDFIWERDSDVDRPARR